MHRLPGPHLVVLAGAAGALAVLLAVGCTSGGDPAGAPPEQAPSVPADARVVVAEERDGARYEVSTAGGCDHLRVTNLADDVSVVRELCLRHAAVLSETCLERAGADRRADDPDSDDDGGGSSGSGGGGGSEEAPPCTSEVPWAAVWGRVPFDFVDVACVLTPGDAVVGRAGADGVLLLLVPPEAAGEPVYLLADGRGVQGEVWSALADEQDLARCRAAGGLPEPEVAPTFGSALLDGIGVVAGAAVVELSTDTGWAWAGNADLVAGPVDRVVAYPDTSQLVARGLDDEGAAVHEVTIALGEDLRRLAATAPCFELAVDLEAATAAAQPCPNGGFPG